MKQYIIASLAITLAACQTTKPPVIETPDNFIQTVTGSESSFDTIKQNNPDLVIRFEKGKDILTDKSVRNITDWVENKKPVLVAVQGLAGKLKHQIIGEGRALSTMKLLLDLNVSVLKVPYEETTMGLRAYLWSLESNQIILANETLAAFIATP